MSRRSWKRGITVVAVMSVAAMVVLGAARARRPAPCATAQSVTTTCMFDDIAGNEFATQISGACTGHLMSGCGGTYFCPGEFITREDLAVSLVVGLHCPSPALPVPTPRSDVLATYCLAPWIQQLFNDGIIADPSQSCPSGSFCPYNPPTRAQLSELLGKAYYVKIGQDPQSPQKPSGLFPDMDGQQYDYARPWAEILYSAGFSAECLHVTSGGPYSPDRKVTRAEAACLVYNTFGGAAPACMPSATITPTATPAGATPTATKTATSAPTVTRTPTFTRTPSGPTPTATRTATRTPTGPTPTATRTATRTPTSSTTHTLTVLKVGNGTVTSSPSGINCGSVCSHAFGSGTSVTLTATADPGWVFDSWGSDGCWGNGTCVVTMDADTVRTANFALATPTPTRTPVPPTATYTVTRTATPVPPTLTPTPTATHPTPTPTRTPAPTSTPRPSTIRGDADGNGVVNVSDIFYLNNYLSGVGPGVATLCQGDANTDGAITSADVDFLTSYLFSGGPAPNPPLCATPTPTPTSTPTPTRTPTATPRPSNIRGDADGNGVVNVSDIFYLNNYLSGAGPGVATLCQGDANTDGVITSADIDFLTAYLFSGGPAPNPPNCS